MRTEYWCEYYWAGTFRENHNMWFGIQDTTISYLIARNPWLKKQNSCQSTKELVYYIVASTAPHETWKVEDPACPCLCHCLRHCHIIFTTCHLERRVPSLAMSLSLSCLVFVIFLSLSLSLSLSYHLNHLVLGEESSQLGHVCWAEFPFKLVQRWPVLLARLTIMIIAQIQMLWLYDMGHVSCEK